MLFALEELENGYQSLKIKVGEPDGSRKAILTVGESKAQFSYGSLIMEVGKPKAWEW